MGIQCYKWFKAKAELDPFWWHHVMVRLFAVSLSCEQPPIFSETFDRSNRSVGMW